MLILVTGSPGAGKTSNTLWSFMHDPEYANRPKFAVDLPDFDSAKHGIGLIDNLENWEQLPDGSVVFVDESQRFLRPRSSRVVPDWLGAFETHRHRGFDFIFITQHPSLIDSHIRRLVGRHVHYHRPFGLKTATRAVWEFCQDNPTLVTFKTADVQRVKANPAVFTLYKSTVLDTHKANLPWKKIMVGVMAATVAIGGFSWLFLGYGMKHATQQTITDTPSHSAVATTNPLSSPVPVVDGQKHFDLLDLVPREKSLPWTAPYYDELTNPTDFPRLSACIEKPRTGDCHCYTQQATPLDIDQATCKAIVKNGVFDQWKSGRDQQNVISEQTGAGEVPTKEERTRASARTVDDVDLSRMSYTETPHYTTDTLSQSGYSSR